MKKTVWIGRDDNTDDFDNRDRHANYRLHLREPEWEKRENYGFWHSPGGSLYICQRAAKAFLGKDTLSPGQCVEVNCTLGTVWEK